MILKKMLIVTLYMLFILSTAAGAGDQERKFPEWVPEGAVEAAERIWIEEVRSRSIESLRNSFPDDLTKDEALNFTLKHPYKLMKLRVEDYQKGDSISKYLVPSIKEHLGSYGFSLFINKQQLIGSVSVYFRDNKWIMEGIGAFFRRYRDIFAPIYDKYPLSSGYIYVKELNETYFVLKDGVVVDAFRYSREQEEYRSIDPVEYILKEKKRREEWREMHRKAGHKLPERE